MTAPVSIREAPAVADRLALLDLHARYAATIDAGDADGWATCFTPDGVLETTRPLRVAGRRALAAFAAAWHADSEGQPRHATWQHRFEAGEGEVLGTCYAALLRTTQGSVGIAFTAVYRDRFVRTEDGWRIRERCVAIDRG